VPRGLLIVFEGAEGVGKSTQLRRLVSWLEARGRLALALREPGGTPLGDEIRRLLLDPNSDITPRAEALLFMASRAQLVRTRVRPALDAGQVVLLDRFFLSTYAYQGAGRGLPEHEVMAANAVATSGLVPDLTLLLTLPVAEGLSRATQRGERDRMERNADDFHHRVADAFATFAGAGWQARHPECGPIVTVDGSGSGDDVFARVRAAVEARLA
jgi:dTMP kinase